MQMENASPQYVAQCGKPLHFRLFRCGIAARMQARMQFGCQGDRCGASLTYPIAGMPWRRNVTRHYLIEVGREKQQAWFAEILALPERFPADCLNADAVVSDAASEKANSILRERASGVPCYFLTMEEEGRLPFLQIFVREDARALHDSRFFHDINALLATYEKP